MSIEQIVKGISETQRETQRKLELLKSLLQDPALMPYVAPFLRDPSKNGNNRAHSNKQVPVHSSAPNSNGLRAEIRALELLPSQFTVEDVVEALKAREFDFEGRKPESAVRDCLYVLAKRQKGFRLAKKGKGGKANLYEKTL
jgi:hypothetical protein